MFSYRSVISLVTAIALVSGGRLLVAKEDAAPPAKPNSRLDAWATKLGLSDKQKEEVRKIHDDFEKQIDPVEEQLWTLHHEEHEAMKKVLTDEQRTKLPTAIKAELNRECDTIATKLSLSDEQKHKIGKIREEYEPKFHDLARQSSDDARKQIRDLRSEFFTAVRKELNDEQRSKFWGVLREEFHQWRDPVSRHEHLQAIADDLGLSADQKDQIKKIQSDYRPKVEKLSAQIKEMWRGERTALEKVLTEDQRTKAHEMWKTLSRSDDKTAPKTTTPSR